MRLVFKDYKVSIVIPVYNSHGAFRRQMMHFEGLSLSDSFEGVIVDDGSDPPLLGAVKRLPKNFKIYITGDTRPWTQPCAANLGVKIAQGRYIFRTDIDHIITEEAIKAAESFDGDKMEFLREYGVLDSKGSVVQKVTTLMKYGFKRERYKRRGLRLHRHTNTFLMKRRIFMEIDGYPEKLCGKGKHHIYDDAHLYQRYKRWVKAGKCLPAVMGPKVLTFPGTHEDPKGLFHNLDRSR